MQDEACSILGSIEEKYCNQNKFVAENFEDIWTQLSEGKTVKNVLESFNFEVHELVSLTKEEVEEVKHHYFCFVLKSRKYNNFSFYCTYMLLSF